MSYLLLLIKSLAFVRTAGCPFEGLVRPSDCSLAWHSLGCHGAARRWPSKVKVIIRFLWVIITPRHACTCMLSPARGGRGTAWRATTRPPPGASLSHRRYLLASQLHAPCRLPRHEVQRAAPGCPMAGAPGPLAYCDPRKEGLACDTLFSHLWISASLFG